MRLSPIAAVPVLILALTVPASAAPEARAAAPEPGAAPVASTPATAERSEIRFTVAESALLDALKAAAPFTLVVGNPLVSAELVFSEPRDMVLREGKATFKIRVRGTTLPIDQMLQPVCGFRHDPRAGRYYVVVSSLPLTLPGIGTVDLKQFLPQYEVPALLENLWRFETKPVGLNLAIQRLAIREHLLEVSADISFAPVQPGPRAAR